MKAPSSQRDSADPFHQIMMRSAQVLRARLPAIIAATETRVRVEHPELVARLEPEVLTAGIRDTHERFVEFLLGDRSADRAGAQVALGAAVAVAGIGLDALMACYRIGSWAAWQELADARRTTGPFGSAEVTEAFVAATLDYLDLLTVESVRGYQRMAARAAAARTLDRQRLLDAVVDGAAIVGSAAGGWVLGDAVAALVVRGPAPWVDESTVLLGRRGERTVGFAQPAAVAVLTGPFVIGPAVPVARAAHSLAVADRLDRLARAGVLPSAVPLRADDHLVELVLAADPTLAGLAVADRLGPLAGLPPARAAMLRETLAAWLDFPHSPTRIARALHLHPQTVRYRIGQLRVTFGDALDDLRERFGLAVALRLAELSVADP